MDDILRGSTPCEGICRALAERRRFLQALQADADRATSERLKARDAAAPIYTLEELAFYVFDRVVHPSKPWNEEYLIHEAIFWACACWAHLRHTALTTSAPQRYPQGPYFAEVADVIKQWREKKAAPPKRLVTDTEFRAVLDAAVDHVKRLGCAAVIAEVHKEPLWAFTGHRESMKLLVDVYSHSDPTGALHRIFPSILHSPPPVSAAASSHASHRIVEQRGLGALPGCFLRDAHGCVPPPASAAAAGNDLSTAVYDSAPSPVASGRGALSMPEVEAPASTLDNSQVLRKRVRPDYVDAANAVGPE